MADVLLDSSAWIDFLRRAPDARARIDPLLSRRRGATCGPIYAEVISGAPGREVYDRLARLLARMKWLEPPDHVWQRIAEARFSLARLGVAAAVPDLWIALTASHAGCGLLTRDRDFERIARVVPIDLEMF